MNSDTPTDNRRDLEVLEPVSPSETPEPMQAPGPRETWGYRDLIYLVMFAVPAFFVTAAVGMIFLYGLDLPLEEPPIRAPVVIGVQLVWWIAVLAYIYTVVTVKYELPFRRSIGWIGMEQPPGVYLSGGVLLAVTVGVLSYFLPRPEGRLPIEELLEDPVAMTLMALFGVLIAPAVEEIVFRGFVFPVIERSHGALAAIVVTSVIFSLVHGTQYGWRWQNLLLLLGVGMVFGAVRARTGSVISTTLIHAAYNATLFAALFAAGDQIKNL